jgi:hypothetical protein
MSLNPVPGDDTMLRTISIVPGSTVPANTSSRSVRPVAPAGGEFRLSYS